MIATPTLRPCGSAWFGKSYGAQGTTRILRRCDCVNRTTANRWRQSAWPESSRDARTPIITSRTFHQGPGHDQLDAEVIESFDQLEQYRRARRVQTGDRLGVDDDGTYRCRRRGNGLKMSSRSQRAIGQKNNGASNRYTRTPGTVVRSRRSVRCLEMSHRRGRTRAPPDAGKSSVVDESHQ